MTSYGVQYGGGGGECDADHGGNHLRDPVGGAQMHGDGPDRQECQSDSRGDPDGGPQQPGQSPEHTGELERADDSPLDR